MNKTYSQKPAEVTREWYEIDASGQSLGRLATVAARILSGKDKPTYTPHIDGGDYVVVTNASKVIMTGNKSSEFLYSYSGYPGGLKAKSRGDVLAENPEKLVELAVRGMLPANKLRPAKLARLKVFSGPEHDHAPQKPKKLENK